MLSVRIQTDGRLVNFYGFLKHCVPGIKMKLRSLYSNEGLSQPQSLSEHFQLGSSILFVHGNITVKRATRHLHSVVID